MTGSENLQNCSSCGVFPACGGQYLTKWSTEGTAVAWCQGHVPPRLIDAHGEQRLSRVVQLKRGATVAQLLKRLMLVLTERCQNTVCHR